jgi:hypothetical protein
VDLFEVAQLRILRLAQENHPHANGYLYEFSPLAYDIGRAMDHAILAIHWPISNERLP